MQFDALTVVTLIRPDDAPQLTEAEEDITIVARSSPPDRCSSRRTPA
jgi:hypothetical protein